MNAYNFNFCNTSCRALPSGALHLPKQQTLCVSDLHLGKSDRIARRSGVMLPPYEVQETLEKLENDIKATTPQTVICLGDSFDDLDAAESLSNDMRLWLTKLQAGRQWIWIEGNHDPGPIDLGGTHLKQTVIGTLTFRHIATSAKAEVSGHYHPYTGGLSSQSPDLRRLFDAQPIAILTGTKSIATPVTDTTKSRRR